MESMAISQFKATCLAVLERVRKTGLPVQITRRGVPVAQVGPPEPTADPGEWLGAMRGTGTICGDITVPSSDLVDWENS